MDPLKCGLVLCTDASDMAIGAVLMQEGRVIAYESRKLNNAELNYPVHEKELLAIIHALKVWRHYLLGSEFKIETDHQSLRYLTTQANLNRRQSRWMELMQEFNFEIQYVKGKENVVADTLSRRPFLNAVSFVKDTILDQIKGGYKDDVFFSIPFESLSKEARTQEEINKFSTYALDANILYYKSRICVPEVGDYRKNIIYDCHNIPISGHPGFQKTYAVVKK
jgi:ribonuclease HI